AKPTKKARGARRAKPRAPGAVEAVPAPIAVPAHAMAEMPATARVGSTVAVKFTLSWLRVAPEPGAIVDDAEITLDPERPVTISISTHGFRLAKGTRRVREVHLRRNRDKEVRWFSLEAVDLGVGEVTIVVRQGHETPLATLRLTPQIVAGAAADGAATANADAVPPDPAVTALPTISIDESLAGGEATLDIAVQIGDLIERGAQRKIDKAVVVADTYEQISTLCARLRNEPDPGERMRVGLDELRAIGVGLARKLFSRQVREFLWKHIDELDHLVIQTTGEFDIPWEIVYISDPGDTVDGKDVNLDQFLGMRGATRWVYNTALPTRVTVGRGRAMYLCPSYRDRRLSLGFTFGEGKLVRSVFKAKVVRPGDAASMTKVISDGFDLLHFGGHGVWTATPPDQRLLLARYRKTGVLPDGSSYSATDLRRDMPARAMVDTNAPAPMVFLNACDVGRLDTSSPGLGGFPEAFLRGGVGVLVGCCWAVDDKIAGRFVHDFYDALKTTDLAGAVSRARRNSLENADLSGLAYVAYAHPHTTVTIA
ncbi:MAG: CHAT domain-containing protein, partial [Microbacterium sp.]